jgi:hypothetical protein
MKTSPSEPDVWELLIEQDIEDDAIRGIVPDRWSPGAALQVNDHWLASVDDLMDAEWNAHEYNRIQAEGTTGDFDRYWAEKMKQRARRNSATENGDA